MPMVASAGTPRAPEYERSLFLGPGQKFDSVRHSYVGNAEDPRADLAAPNIALLAETVWPRTADSQFSRTPPDRQATRPGEDSLNASEPEGPAVHGSDAGEDRPAEQLVDPDVRALLAEIRGRLDSIEDRFEARFTYDTTKEAAFRHVYADLQEARLAQSLESARPLLLDLLLLYDRVHTAISSLGSGEEPVALVSFREELLELLYRREVQTFVSVSTRYDSETQQVVGVVDTSKAEEHQQIDRIVRAGFRWRTRILRAEDVVIRRYRPGVPLSGGPA
jgi:molecular chaperone GrpE